MYMSKLVTKMSELDKCRVVSVEGLNPLSPILVNFDHGFHSDQLYKSSLKCDLYVDPKKKENRAVILERGNKQFVGQMPSNELSQTLILVRNRKTNEARIYVSQYCTLLDADKEEEKFKKSKRLATDEARDDQTYSTREHSLRMSFGSKKSKRASNLSMKLNMKGGGNKEDIKNAVKDVNVSLTDVNTSNVNDDGLMKLLPPCNRSAKSPQEVYRVNDLISEEELDSLLPSAEFLINNSLADLNENTSLFLISHYKKLGSQPDPKKIALLIYGNSLISFFNMLAHQMKSRDSLKKICPQSGKIASKIMKDFTVLSNNVRTRPNYCKDKIVCHVMVLILITCDFEVDIEILSSCLKGFGQKKLQQLARVVGLTTRSRSSKTYVLKVPLPPLPQVRMAKKKN